MDSGALTKKPAHLLVAELEAEAEKKRARRTSTASGTHDSAADEISSPRSPATRSPSPTPR
jgi:hypothetical protein